MKYLVYSAKVLPGLQWFSIGSGCCLHTNEQRQCSNSHKRGKQTVKKTIPFMLPGAIAFAALLTPGGIHHLR
jgi:hypothetical protein